MNTMWPWTFLAAVVGCKPAADVEVVDLVTCGEGTVLQGSECVPADCGIDADYVGGDCFSTPAQWLHLPFEPGDFHEVIQGAHGTLSHNGESVNAIDFRADEGTPITAARGGIVMRVKEDSDSGCPDSSCASEANYIWVDHGDATTAKYVHLELDGALVEVGDHVCAGDVIGLSGNTGFSTTPHLHFAVEEPLSYALPLRFFELEDQGGAAAPGSEPVSDNAPQDTCEATDWSMCPGDLYAHLGVLLDAPFPCGKIDLGEPLVLSGETTAGTHVEFNQWSVVDQAWIRTCDPVDADGRFEAELTWRRPDHEGHSWFLVRPAELDAGDCDGFQGWDHSAFLAILDE